MKNYRIKILAVLCFAAAFAMTGSGTASAFSHYTPGALALNAGTLPPPGLHYTIYNVFYNADNSKDDDGNSQNIGFDLNVFASAHQFTYMMNHKILGADYGINLTVPLVYTDVEIEAAGINESTFGLGDICFEPILLGWHGPKWDISFAAGFYAPTGEHDDPSSPGKGHWSFMETLGGTYYFDDARTWNISILTRWLQNNENDDNITRGPDMVAEYGLVKAFPLSKQLVFSAGVAGYTYAQLDDDSGDNAIDGRESGNAIGPEIRFITFKPFPIQMSFRYLIEYGVENAPEGRNAVLTLIGSF